MRMMNDFGNVADGLMDLLNPQICTRHSCREMFFLDEKAEAGCARIHLSSRFPCLHVRQMDKQVFPVLKNQRCADHLVLVYDSGRNAWGLHIFEMTKTVSNSRWRKKILPQFSGGLANAYAISGVLRIPSFSAVTAHCCYRFDGNRTSPVEMKMETGKKAGSDWTEGETFCLEEFPGLPIRKSLLHLDEKSGEMSMGTPLEL